MTKKKQRRSRLTFISDTSEDPPLTLFLYGHSKSGKTVLAASSVEVAEMSPVLMIDCGTSSDSIRGEGVYEDVDIIRILEFDGISEAYAWLSPEGKNQLEERGYRTIILDELDKLHRKALDRIMKRNMATGDRHGKSRANRTDLWIEDFGEAREMILGVVEAFLKLNVNLVCCSLVRIKEDDLDLREYRMPSIAGQLRDDVPSMMAVYAYLDVQIPTRARKNKKEVPEATRIAYFEPTRKFKAGVWGPSRADRFGAEMEDPTMKKIYDAFVGKGT